MRAKTILTVLFLISIGVAVVVILRTLPTQLDANASTAKEEILVATVPLAAGTLLRAQDVTWQPIARPADRGEIVRPSEAARQTKPEIDEERERWSMAPRCGRRTTPQQVSPFGAAVSSSRATATFSRSCCRLERERSQSLLPPAGRVLACCSPATAST
jgi:hypothetical protein